MPQKAGSVTQESEITFSSEENEAIASIDLNAIRPILPKDQFDALAKMIGCISGFVSLSNMATRQ